MGNGLFDGDDGNQISSGYFGDSIATTTDEGNPAIFNADGEPALAPGVTALEVTNLLGVDVADLIDNGDFTYTITKTDGQSFTIEAGDDPRVVRSATVPPLTGSVLIWIDTRTTPNTFNFWDGTTFSSAGSLMSGRDVVTAINADPDAGQIDTDNLNLEGLQVAPYSTIFFNVIFGADNYTITGVGDASTVRDEFTQGGTQHTTRHTHYAFVERNSTRYFDQDAGTAAQILASFNASETFIGLLETDVLVGRLEYTPLATRSNNDFTIHNNTWHWTEGAYYEIGDIVAYTGNDNLQFYLVSGSDIVSAPANPTAVLPPSVVTLEDVELSVNRLAITYSRNLFFPDGIGNTEILGQGTVLQSGGKLWVARSSGTQTLLGTPGYDNLTNWRPLADVEIRTADSPDPAPDEQVPGRVWYNPNTNELKYHNGNRDVILLDNQNIQQIVERDIAGQRFENHANVEGEFSLTQEQTQPPANQRDVAEESTVWIRNRTDAGGGGAQATLTSLRFDANDGTLGTFKIFVQEPTLSGTNAGRQQGLSWWNTERLQYEADSAAGRITYNVNGTPNLECRVSAVGNIPTGEVQRGLSRGEAYVEIEVLQELVSGALSAIVTGNTFDWLQSDGTDIDGNPEDTSDYFFLDAGAPDTWMEGWTSVAEVDILHQNAALVGRVGTDGQVRFTPHEVPVIYEANVEYFTGQLVFNAGSTSGGFYRANQDIPANSGGFDTSEWTEVSLATRDPNTPVSVDDIAISPSTVQVGGTTGRFTLRQNDNHITRGAQVGEEADTTFFSSTGSVSAGQIIIPTADLDADWVLGTTYYMTVSGSADSVMTPGDYLATYSTTTSSGGVFTNIRPITNNAAGTIQTMNSNSTTSIRFTLHNFSDLVSLAVTNGVGGTVDALHVNENNVTDFVAEPTVNGTLISELHPEITWTFGMPSAGRDIQAGVVYPCIMYQENLTGQGIRLQASHFDIESGVPNTLYRESDDGSSWIAVGTNPTTGGIHLPASFSFVRFGISFSATTADNLRQNISNVLRGVFSPHSNTGTSLVATIGTVNGLPGYDNGGDDTGVQQNHQDIVHLEAGQATQNNRIDSLENALHTLEAGGRRVATTFFREVQQISLPTIDEVTQYYAIGDDTLSSPETFGQTAINVNETAVFTAESTAIGGDLIGRLNNHLDTVLRRLLQYRRTTAPIGDVINVDPGGRIFTRHGTVALIDGSNFITLPLLVSYDGQGDVHHTLYFPYPVAHTINYTQVIVRYFVNDFLNADGSDNTGVTPTSNNSSVGLAAHGLGNQLSVPLATADWNTLNTDFNTDSDNGQFHFVQHNGTAAAFNVANYAQSTVPANDFGGYRRANIQLTGFNSATGTDPGPNARGLMVVNGVEFGAPPLFGLGQNGIVPAPSQAEFDAGNEFLRADGGWHVPAANIPDAAVYADLLIGGFVILNRTPGQDGSGGRAAWVGAISGRTSRTYWYDPQQRAWYDAAVAGNRLIGFGGNT